MGSGYVTHRDICRWRLAGQFLTTPGPSRAVELVRALGAVQAQDYAGAKWALGQRLPGATAAEVEREIDEGRVLRTHVLRPTWHLVAAEDLRWMLALTGPRVMALTEPANRRLGLDREVYRKSHRIFEKALAGGRHLTRTELRSRLEDAGIPVGTGQRLGHLMMRAELEGVVCSGAKKGNQFTYALVDERAPAAPSLNRDEALRELTTRYFGARGPAAVHDFAWWSGLTITDAKRGIEMVGGALEQLRIGDGSYWRAADRPASRRAMSAHLLPNFDEYFIGYRDRRAIAVRSGDASSVMVTNALVPNVIIADGQLVGVWKRVLTKSAVVVSLRFSVRITDAEERRVRKAAERYAGYLELPLELDVEKVARR